MKILIKPYTYILVLSLSLFLGQNAFSVNCQKTVNRLASNKKPIKKKWPMTNLELDIKKNGRVKESLSRQYKRAIKKLAKTNPELANKALVAWKKRYSEGGALNNLIDFSSLPNRAMNNFLEGPFFDAVGNRGISEPFVKIFAKDNNTLIIEHIGDLKKMVRWSEDISSPLVHLKRIEGIEYQVLDLPLNMVNKKDFKELRPKVMEFIAGSSMHPYIDASKDLIMTLSALLHNGKLIQNRPSQVAFKKLWKESFSKLSTLKKFTSLMYVAPTATGKTRVLGIAIGNKLTETISVLSDFNKKELEEIRSKLINIDNETLLKIKSDLNLPSGTETKRILVEFSKSSFEIKRRIRNRINLKLSGTDISKEKKVTILLTKDPDLINQNALAIGLQLAEDLPQGGYRAVQWGGNNSNQMKFDELLDQIKNTDQPIFLTTSSISLFLRARPAGMEELFKYVNFIAIDEAHQMYTEASQRMLQMASTQAAADRRKTFLNLPLTILGVTATPVEKGVRSVNLFQHTYWALIDTPKQFTNAIRNGLSHAANVFEWVRVPMQLMMAKRAGEITAPDQATFIDPSRIKDGLESLFKVYKTKNGGYVVKVQEKYLPMAWKVIGKKILKRGKTVIDAYPRDAIAIATAFSKESGKNFVPIGPGLKTSEKNAIYSAFSKQIPYPDKNGKVIYGIVGPMKAGLDFPFIGSYISMKKFVKFPELFQGPGRAYRLFKDKLEPLVIFFGQAPEELAFKSIRRKVLSESGEVQDTIKATTAFTGRKKPELEMPESIIGKKIGSVNTTIEHIFRKNSHISKNFGTVKEPNSKAIEAFSDIIKRTRSSKYDYENSEDIKNFIFDLQAFSFFKGNLNQTWEYCDQYLKLKKKLDKGTLSKKILEDEKTMKILKDSALIEEMEEFFRVKKWLGAIPRLLLGEMELRPHGIFEVAESINSFISKNKRVPRGNLEKDMAYGPIERSDQEFLVRRNLELILRSSSKDSFISRLNYESRSILDQLIHKTDNISIEEDISEYIKLHQTFPNFIFDKLYKGVYTHQDKLQHSLASRLQSFIQSGRISLDKMSEEALSELDRSEIFIKQIDVLLYETSLLTNPIFRIKGNELDKLAKKISMNFLLKSPDHKIMKTLDYLAKNGYPNAIKKRKELIKLVDQIKTRGPSSLESYYSEKNQRSLFDKIINFFKDLF